MASKKRRSWKRAVLWTIAALVALFALMQAIPYGRAHDNPPVTNPFIWSDPQAETIARESCYDCHSNETRWWWATNIAPFSWLVQSDVDGGRKRLNFSEYQGRPSASSLEEALSEMPPFQYTLVHPGAKLTEVERRKLVQGYEASLPANAGSSSGGSDLPGTAPGTDTAALSIIDRACTGCHSADLALNYHASSTAEARSLIDSMVRRGAKLTSEQEQSLIAYFTR